MQSPQQTNDNKTETSELVQAIEQYLGKNPTLGRAAVVQLLTKRFPALSRDQVWISVARYFKFRA
jgi:hypothetical protein